APPAKQPAAPAPVKVEPAEPRPWWHQVAGVGIGAIALIAVLTVAPPAFVGLFGIFALACVVGYYVVWNVTHALHTPLMSVTNAISGIIIVGAMTQLASGNWAVKIIAVVAVLLASINVFGGFAVTHRMLGMFRKG
ncbi:MAG: proton-translocating transhydrogenase family protein, partial [Propionibacterium sp.]|nr:proton-translocating transhydrogenase family protein [Propionibacterium sp.]